MLCAGSGGVPAAWNGATDGQNKGEGHVTFGRRFYFEKNARANQ